MGNLGVRSSRNRSALQAALDGRRGCGPITSLEDVKRYSNKMVFSEKGQAVENFQYFHNCGMISEHTYTLRRHWEFQGCLQSQIAREARQRADITGNEAIFNRKM